MKLVMFDIDGTLTQTCEADETCFIKALEEVFAFTGIDTDWAGYPHCSDSGIIETLFRSRLSRSPFPEEVSAFQDRFLSLLRNTTAKQPFSPIPGAHAFLQRLSGEPNIAVSLASGAWEISARFKLASAGLQLRHLAAAFSDDAHAREEIMKASLVRATRLASRSSFCEVVYVGDAIWDARAARNLGFRFIGIATEPKKVSRLYSEGACRVFSDYLEPHALLKALEAPCVCSRP